MLHVYVLKINNCKNGKFEGPDFVVCYKQSILRIIVNRGTCIKLNHKFSESPQMNCIFDGLFHHNNHYSYPRSGNFV